MLKYILLGFIQGVTEFLPVSSSGHLVILQRVLGVGGEEIALSVILHLGTLFAVIIFFFKDILKLLGNIKSLLLIAIVTIITGTIGIVGKDFFEGLFSSLKPVVLALVVTGIILLLTKRFMDAKRNSLNIKDAFFLGLAQGLAIIPGISRSGITISTLLFRKIDRETSFKFSFLASIPVILGAALLEAKKIDFALQFNLLNFAAGFMSSFLTGLFALWVLKLVLQKAKLHYFGYYCIVVAIATFLLM